MSAASVPDFDRRSDLQTFRALGQAHALRSYAFYVGAEADYQKFFDQARDLEMDLGQRRSAQLKRNLPRGPLRPALSDSAAPQRWASYQSVASYPQPLPEAAPDNIRRTLLGLRLSAAAIIAMARWDLDSVKAPDVISDVDMARDLLVSAGLWLNLRSEVASTTFTRHLATASLEEPALDLRQQVLKLAGPPEWNEWLSLYEDRTRSSSTAFDLDIQRGLLDVAESHLPVPDLTAVAPEVLGSYVRLRGARLNRFERFRTSHPRAGLYADVDIDRQIGVVCEQSYLEAVKRTGSDPLPLPVAVREQPSGRGSLSL